MGGTGLWPKSVAPRQAATADGPWYHGARSQFSPGDTLTPQGKGARNNDDPRSGHHVYFTRSFPMAAWAADNAKGSGPGRVYEVRPTGPYEDDPTLISESGTNPTQSHRTKHPVEVVREVGQDDFEYDPAAKRVVRKASVWTPQVGIFGATTGLDPQLFEGGSLRPMVRAEIMERLDRCIRVDVQLAGSDWQQWLRVWLAGGSASEWAGSRPNDAARDLDVLVGIDLAKAQGFSSFEGMDAQQAATALNAAFRAAFNDPYWQPASGGTWALTAYCNPHVGSDITAICPYAAWDLTRSEWAVRPPHLPEHTIADFDPATVAHARAVLAEARAILRMPEPLRTREARALWQHVHEHRCEAFSAEGTGWDDVANVDEKWLQYAPGGVLNKIKDLAYADPGNVVPGNISRDHEDMHSLQGRQARGRGSLQLGASQSEGRHERPLEGRLQEVSQPSAGRADAAVQDGRNASHLRDVRSARNQGDVQGKLLPAVRDDSPGSGPEADDGAQGRFLPLHAQHLPEEGLRDHHRGVRGDAGGPGREVRDLPGGGRGVGQASAVRGSQSRDGQEARAAVRGVQLPSDESGGRPGAVRANGGLYQEARVRVGTAAREEDEGTDRYVTCGQGHQHWGSAGAAGLLIRHRGDDGQYRYLLQHRSPYVQHGGTWSTPGGALHHGETPEQGARREAEEEFGPLPETLAHHHTFTDDHGAGRSVNPRCPEHGIPVNREDGAPCECTRASGGWAYHTVVMDSPGQFSPHGAGEGDWETQGHGWFTPAETKDLQLHPGFASSWEKVRKSGAVQKTAAPQPWMEWAASDRPHQAVIWHAQQRTREEHPELTERLPDPDWEGFSKPGEEILHRALTAGGYPPGQAARTFVMEHGEPERSASQVARIGSRLGVALHPGSWHAGTIAHEAGHLLHIHHGGLDPFRPMSDRDKHGPEFAGHYATALNAISPGAGDDFLRHHADATKLVGNYRFRAHGLPRDLDADIRREAAVNLPAWHGLAEREPNHAVFSAVQDQVRQAHPELSAPVADPTGTVRRMLGRASFILPKSEIDTAQAPAGQHDTLSLAHHAAHVITGSRQAREDAVPRMSGEDRPLSGEMDPDDRSHGHGFAWHYALALDGAGHDQAADDLRRGYPGAQVQVADHRHAQGLPRDFPGSGLSPHMPPDLDHLPEMPESQRKAMAPGAHRDALLGVARNPEPGTRIWRGERRETAEHTPDASSVGMHWSVHPSNTITDPYNDDKGQRPVLWQARLEHPAEQAIPRSHPMWQGRHMSMDSEAEVRLRPGSSVHVEGAWVGQPGGGARPVHPLNPGRNGPGWEWHPVDHHIPVAHRPGDGHSIDYSDVGIPKEAAASSLSFAYAPATGSGSHSIVAHPEGAEKTKENRVGRISWADEDAGPRIVNLWVHPDFQRRGVATEMYRRAREIAPGLRHSDSPTEDGRGWISGMELKTAAASDGPWYHGTDKELNPDDLIEAGKYAPSQPWGSREPRDHVYFSDRKQYLTEHYGPNIYEVEPTGPHSHDPEYNNRRMRRSKHPLRVVRKVSGDWGSPVEASRHEAVTGYENLTERSGMIYLDIPDGKVRHLPGGVDDHHITLVYLGNDVSDKEFAEAVRRTKEAAGNHPPMEGSIGGLGSFPPSDSSDGKKPVFVPVDVPGIHALYKSLEDLSGSEFKDYKPHVTLAYLKSGEAMPAPHPTVPVSFGRLRVKRGDDIESFPFGGHTPKTASWDHSGSEHSGVYLRFGHWPDDEKSYSPAGGYKEEGVSAYDLDRNGDPSIDHGLDRGHVHDEHCEDDCPLDYNEDYGNDPREEMQDRVKRAEKNRYYGEDRPGDTGHLVRGEMSGVGYDGEPLLKNVRRVGDWIDHRHLFLDQAHPHRLARDPAAEDYEEPEEKAPHSYRDHG
jgi:8-oxo-dGTP diphosphatase